MKKLEEAGENKGGGREDDRNEYERSSRHLFLIMSGVHTAAEILCSPPFPRLDSAVALLRYLITQKKHDAIYVQLYVCELLTAT